MEDFGFLLEDGNNYVVHVPENPVPKYYCVIMKYCNKSKWAKITASFKDVETNARKKFPDLPLEKLVLSDVHGTIIEEDFLEEFLNINDKGVIIEINRGDCEPVTDKSIRSCSTISINSDVSFSPCPSTSSVDNDKDKISPETLKDIIIGHTGGEIILNEYKSKNILSDSNRKKLVNIIVAHMLNRFNNAVPKIIKIEYAKALVNLLPSLKDPDTIDGYEAFFDPATNTGFFCNRIRTVTRSLRSTCSSSKRIKPNLDTDISSSEDEEIAINIQEAVEYLKHACPKKQNKEIVEKTKLTYKYRRTTQDILQTFPRFTDTEGLISIEFSLLHPNHSKLQDKFPALIETIFLTFKSCFQEIRKIEIYNNLIQSDWNRTTKAIIALAYLLPPTAKGKLKAARDNIVASIDRIIVFQKCGQPIENILQSKKTDQPFLMAVGPSKGAIQQYFLIIDNTIIDCYTAEIIDAFDILFKSFFVFNVKYDYNLETFYNYIQNDIYAIPGAVITPRIREIRSKIKNITE